MMVNWIVGTYIPFGICLLRVIIIIIIIIFSIIIIIMIIIIIIITIIIIIITVIMNLFRHIHFTRDWLFEDLIK